MSQGNTNLLAGASFDQNISAVPVLQSRYVPLARCGYFWPTLWLATHTGVPWVHHGRLGRAEATLGFHARALSGSGRLVHMTDMLAYMGNIY